MGRLIDQLHDLARAHGSPDPEACRAALEEAARQQRSLVDAVLAGHLVDENEFLKALAEQLGMLWWPEPLMGVPQELREKLPARLAIRHQVFPAELTEDRLWMVCHDPFNLVARQAVNRLLPMEVQWAMSSRGHILQGLRQGYGVGADTFDELLQGRDAEEVWMEVKEETNVLDADDPEISVVKFVNQIIREALEERATDIHVEPLHDDLRIRYRIDGVLHEVPVPPNIKLLQSSVLSRLKIMANLDIAERRLPQDGRINLELGGQPIDVRVATIPSVAGESISLRLLGQERFDIDRLGLDDVSNAKIRQLLALPNGIVLLTGPTGCGKSTSLYTFLAQLNTSERRIVTVEDPVEHKLPGIIQIAVKPEIDLTFARGLRSILRSDPNVIMVGEMRDFETAEIAIRSALTGHLVFSTLHTNDAIGGITRLIDMGVEPFLVGASVRAFVAQRLVRVLCEACRQPGSYPVEYLKEIGFPLQDQEHIFHASGCDQCHQTGYQGREAIFEICMITPRLQDLITRRAMAGELRTAALEEGMVPLRDYGWKKVRQGRTTLEEVVRVTSSDVEVAEE